MDRLYKTVLRDAEGYYEEKKSKFIANVFRVSSEEDVLERLQEIRKLHYEARHHCFAYVLGQDRMKKRCSDDGEPQKTAGAPILQVLEGEEVTDTLIVVSYDVKNQKINMVSVPRDLRVDVSNRSIKKINAAYAYGKMDGLKEEIGRTLGIPIDVTVKVNLRGFAAVINAVGGVDFDVPCGMNYDDPYQDLSIHYRKGMQHLNGQQALEVCRFRQNNGGGGYGDEGRMQTQRAMLSTVAKKILSWNSLTKVNEFVQIFSDNVETNLSAGNLLWFATQAVNFNMEDLNTMSLPAEWINPYMYLDPDATLSLVNEYLNPYVQDRTADMLDIITR